MVLETFREFGECVLLENDGTELRISTRFGPRILYFGLKGGENAFFLFPDGKGALGEGEYRLYGGHRLWVAPEIPSRTMQPDNVPVHVTQFGTYTRFEAPADVNRIVKALEIEAKPGGVWEVRHTVRNEGAFDVELAPWALSMLASGSIVAFPNAPIIPHTDRVLPARPLVLWSYTDLGDRRWTWGRRLSRLEQRHDGGPQKVGTFIGQGYAAAQIHDGLWVKRFDVKQGKDHVDLGCNFETFTNEAMIEIETLGPLVRLEEGESVTHTERWKLYGGQRLPDDDNAAAELLETLAEF